MTEGTIHIFGKGVEIRCRQGQVVILHEDDIKD